MDTKTPKRRGRLKQARVQLCLSMLDAAQFIGVSQQTVADYEAGRSGQTASTMLNLRNLCHAYMAKADELGYDPAQFHECVLCPQDFPQPKQVASPERAA